MGELQTFLTLQHMDLPSASVKEAEVTHTWV